MGLALFRFSRDLIFKLTFKGEKNRFAIILDRIKQSISYKPLLNGQEDTISRPNHLNPATAQIGLPQT